MTGQNEINVQEMEIRLLERRRDLEDALNRDDTVSDPVELDQTRQGRLSRMDAMQLQAMQKATKERMRNEIKRINSALQRIKDGSYGYCIITDEPIETKRLLADPAVPTCLAAARKNN